MRTLRALALGAALIWAGAAHAQGFEYDCDTAAEHFSELKAPARTGAQNITGSITVRDMYRSNEYKTTGAARIGGPNADWSVSLRVGGYYKSSKTDLTGTLFLKRPGEKDLEVVLGNFQAGTPIPFSLTLGADGNGIAQLGTGKAAKFSLPGGQPAEASVTCSTGDILFSNLSFGG
jgi:hypothetical protein